MVSIGRQIFSCLTITLFIIGLLIGVGTLVYAQEIVEVPGQNPLVISQEFGGVSASDNLVNSSESNFTTNPNLGGGSTAPILSGESSFITSLIGAINLLVSDENSFLTLSQSSGGDNNDNNGGGGGGGRSRRRAPQLTPPTVAAPTECPSLLNEYIKFGRVNNRWEVLKLQYFLRNFEGFTQVPLSGVYDSTTFAAVEAFQLRYSRDILGPWGITQPTGYVFITTRLAINNIFCQRSTANTLNLRNFYPRAPRALPQTGVVAPETTVLPTTTLATTTATTTLPSDFCALCWWLVALLLFIIAILLLVIWRQRRELSLERALGRGPPPPPLLSVIEPSNPKQPVLITPPPASKKLPKEKEIAEV